MNSKTFSQRINRELSSMGLPDDITDKVKAVAKLFSINRHQAYAMLFGQSIPPTEDLTKIADVLEVSPEWLCGKSDKKKAVPVKEKETI